MADRVKEPEGAENSPAPKFSLDAILSLSGQNEILVAIALAIVLISPICCCLVVQSVFKTFYRPTPTVAPTATPTATPTRPPKPTTTPAPTKTVRMTTPTPVPPTPTPTPVPPSPTLAPTLTVEERLIRSLHEPWAAKEWETVIGLINQILAINPSYDDMTEKLYAAHVNYGQQLVAEGRLEEAKMEFTRALNVKPDGGEAMDELAALAGETPRPLPVLPPVEATPTPKAVKTTPRPVPPTTIQPTPTLVKATSTPPQTPTNTPTLAPTETPYMGEWISPYAVYDKCGEEPGHPASAFIDGDTGTYWEHQANKNHWVILDLGGSWTVKKIRVYIGAAGECDWDSVDIYVSQDGSTWGSPVFRGGSIAGHSEWVEPDVTDKAGRYIKLEGIDTRGGGNYVRGHEIEAFVK